jgi:Flp pilus assembly pilin Flp
LPETIKRLAREDAQTMAEYVVVLGVITLAIVATFTTMSGSIQTVLERIVGLFS